MDTIKSKGEIRKIHLLTVLLLVVVVLIPFHKDVRRRFESVLQAVSGKKTDGDRLDEFGEIVKKC